MYKLTFKKRVWVVKQFSAGLSVSRIALSQKINRRTVYKIIEKYREFAIDGLRDHKTGRLEQVLNPKLFFCNGFTSQFMVHI